MREFQFLNQLYKNVFYFQAVEIALLCISVETLQVLEVEKSTGGSTKSNVRSFVGFLTIYLSIITRNI
jgi:hypothetical protein